MAREIHWRLPIDADDDVLMFRLVVDLGKVIAFALTYVAVIDGEETEVVRYDTCHSRLHIHRMWLDPPNDLVELETSPSPDYTRAVEDAKSDLLQNWKTYRAKMELMR